MIKLRRFLADAWRLSYPYFASSEERWSARGLLAIVIGLNLALVGMSVVLNFWNRQFFNALQAKDFQSFIELLFTYRHTPDGGFMPGFCEIVVVYIAVAVYSTYLQQALQIRWRRWMTSGLLDEWMAGQAYYRISLASHENGLTGTDNPDQRISDDVREFTANTLSLGISFISNIVTLFSFLGILWSVSGSVTLLGITIPGYMLWVAIIYSVLGTWLTHIIGRPLIALNFQQQRVEADFRYALVRVRENVEGIALQQGEAEEKGHLGRRFVRVVDNWWAIMRRTKRLNTLIFGYNQIANIFPIVVAAPRYFTGALPLGGLTQTADAFGQVQGALSWFVSAYSSLATWGAIIERLATFREAIDAAHAATAAGLATAPSADGAFAMDAVTIKLPNGTPISNPLDIRFPPGRSVVISGRSGAGKSTLFRALAGIWPFGTGTVERPTTTAMFLPQRPYVPLGTLRHAVTYPAAIDAYPDDAVKQALTDCGLGAFIPRLDEDDKWPLTLSGGEQQRLAIARVLLARPDWLFLDEATASLDPAAEAEIYRVLKARLRNTTVVSIAHREALGAFHDTRLVFDREPGRLGTLVPGTMPSVAAAD